MQEATYSIFYVNFWRNLFIMTDRVCSPEYHISEKMSLQWQLR